MPSSLFGTVIFLLGGASLTKAWVSPPVHQPRSPGAAGGAVAPSTGASPRFGRSSLSPRSKPLTRWDAQLERARSAHRVKDWTEVQHWCSRVIDLADDWNAVEQAHLRLALAAQKSSGVAGGRRAFQQGIRDCPSSDTLLVAWALMESKIKHSAHSRRRAWALIRRAIALNPKKNRRVLSWSVFAGDLALAEAAGGGAAVVEAVRSAFSPPPPTPPLPVLPEPTAAGGHAIGGTGAGAGGVSTRAHEREEETILATKLLDLCHSNKGFQDAPEVPPAATAAVPAAAPANSVASAAPSEEFQELAGELERKGGGAGAGVRALSGTWRLVFTTSADCNRYLSRTGNEVYQRLTPPIMAIKPRPSCKQPAPFRCEVLLRPAAAATAATGGGTADASCGTPPLSPPSHGTKAAPKATVAYFFRGWADKSPPDHQREGCLLKQHVAARSATVVAGGGGRGEASAGSPKRAPSPTPPPAVFSALGLVAARCKGLERLATQEVTYVGKQLRIGRTTEGDVYLYERCAWPKDMDFGLVV
ncbi:unnamed protein product [Ectocarpus sp. 12 AP-2014]